MTQRLPSPGGDVGTWGNVLNGYLGVAHNADGTLTTSAVTAAGAAIAANNLSDLATPSAARTNLGLGGAATLNVGSSTGTVAAGDDSRLTLASGASQALSSQAIQTGNYTAGINQLVPTDATSGALTVTLPTAPVDKSRVTVKKIDSSTNIVTVTAGGSDVFNKVGGSTSLTLSLQYQAVSIQYASAPGIWYVVGDDIPLTQLSTQYVAKGSLVFNVKDYGAKGDGSTDDSGSIQSAVNAAQTAGGGTVYLPIGSYYIASSVAVTTSNIRIAGSTYGGTKVLIGYTGAQFNGVSAFTFTGTVPLQTAPTVALSADGTVSTNTSASYIAAQTVSVASSTGLNAGDIVMVGDTYANTWLTSGWGNRYRGEFVQIQSTTSTTVKFVTALRDPYLVSRSAAIYKPTLLTGCSIQDIAFNDAANTTPGTFTNYVGAVYFYGCRDAHATNIIATNLGGSVVAMYQVYQGVIHGCSGINSYSTADVGAAEGVMVSDCINDGALNGFSLGNGNNLHVGYTRNCIVTGCITKNNSLSGFDTHPWATDISFIGCRAERMSAPAYQNRSYRTQFINCVAENINGPMVDIGQIQAVETKIIGCIFKDGSGIGVYAYGNATEGYPSDITVQDCIFQNLLVQPIDMVIVIPNYRVINNTFINPWNSDTSNSTAIYIHGGAAITDAYIIGNTVSGARSLIYSFTQSESNFVIASNRLIDPVGTPIMLRTLAASNIATDNHQVNGTGASSSYVNPITSTSYVQAQAHATTGVTGAIAASRYAGATASGAPSTGTFLLGDFIVDQTGSFWVCTVAGTPGTWVQASSLPTTDIQVFTTSGTWTKPAGAKSSTVTVVGPGGGGGAGARGPSGTALVGGGGGGGGGRSSQTIAASAMTATVVITVNTGGTGATGQTTDGTAGSVGGSAGGSSSFGGYLSATRGGPGAGGGLAAGGSAGFAGGGDFAGTAGGAAVTSGAAGNAATNSPGAPGGGAGGGITTGAVANNGGLGAIPGGSANLTAGTAGTVGGTITGGPGAASTINSSGSSGGGGAGNTTGAGGAGGSAGNYGAGGGGGGASLNGNVSGAGGNGGNGIVVVTTYF